MMTNRYPAALMAWMLVIAGLTMFSSLAIAQETKTKKTGEITLLGISLYDSVEKVLDKYGTPDWVDPVILIGSTDQGSGMGQPGGMGSGSSMMGPGGLPPGVSQPIIVSDSNNSNEPPTGNYQAGLSGESAAGIAPPSGGSSYGMPPMPGTSNSSSGGGSSTTVGNWQQTPVVKYIYLYDGMTIVFIINDQGKVIQIGAVAVKNSKVKTRKGVTFGSSYTTLIKTYGYPKKHSFSFATPSAMTSGIGVKEDGSIGLSDSLLSMMSNASGKPNVIILDYLQEEHIQFQLFNLRVVGITIAGGY